MLPGRRFYTRNNLSQVGRQVTIMLTVMLSACANQVPPIVSPTAGNTVTSENSVTPISQTLTASFTATATIQPQPTNTPSPTLVPKIPVAESTPFIPITGSTPAGNDNANIPVPASNQPASMEGEPDKFQNLEIPVTGENGISVIPLTGFPPGIVTRQKLDNQLPYNSTDLSLVIPSLDIKIPIMGISFRDGAWDLSWLWDQAGWLEGTAYPTRNGNSILMAHVVTADGKNGPFAHLKALGMGEYVFVESSGYRYIYQVISNDLVKPDDTSAFSHEVDSKLTLITCDSYDEKTGTYLLRVIVRAKLVDIRK